METKTCKGPCGLEKPIEEFYFRKDQNKYTNICVICTKQRKKEYCAKNKEKIKKQKAEYYVNNSEKVKADVKEYRENNKDAIKQNRHEYYENNKDAAKAQMAEYYNAHQEEMKQYRIDNKEKREAYMIVYRKENKEEIQKQHNEYVKIKKETDINYRISCYLRSRVTSAIKNGQKAGSAVDDLGCSIDELKQRFESQFYNNSITGEMMNWDNYGFYGWHIDHIIPLTSFDLSDREQFLKACHYTNLQPLWAKDNLTKSDKMDWVKNA